MAGFDPEADIKKEGSNYWVKVTPGRLNTFLDCYVYGGDMEGKNVGTAQRFLAMLEYVAERALTNSKILTTCDVYVFSASGAIKIGIAADENDRLNRLQTAFHDQIRLVRNWTLPNRASAFEVERAAHRFFEKHRQRGECFTVAEEEAEAFIDAEVSRLFGNKRA